MDGPEFRWRKRLDARAMKRRRKRKAQPRDLFAEHVRRQRELQAQTNLLGGLNFDQRATAEGQMTSRLGLFGFLGL